MRASISEIQTLIQEFLAQHSFRDHHHPRLKMPVAEILFIHVMAGLDYGGNYELTLQRLTEFGHIKTPISKSRLSRRLKHLDPVIQDFVAYCLTLKKNLLAPQ
jgi:hypothetical protein